MREFTWRTAFSLAFAFISPIVGLYSIFGLGLAAAGPAFWFGFPIVLAGQLLVALVFGLLVSRFPYEGCVYQWSKHLIGPRYAWFAGWTYAWALPIAMAAVALAGAHFLAELFGLDPSSTPITITLALLLLACATWGNTRGRFILNAVVGLCILAEVVGSVGVGIFLLLFHRVNPLSVLHSTHFFPAVGSWDSFFNSPAALAVAIAGWAFLGFESAGSVAEEVRAPEKTLPKAMVLSLLCVAGVISFAALSLILALPHLDKAVAGAIADPVADTLAEYFGHVGLKVMLALFMVGFIACILGMQASVSRVIWAFARDDELPGAGWLKRLAGEDQLPVNAILLTGAMALSMFLFSFTNVYPILVAFTTAGFYIAFGFPILAAAWTHLRGRWVPGPFQLGVLTGPVIYLAAVWIVFETINIAWPRSPAAPWYENWAVPVMVTILAILGVILRSFTRAAPVLSQPGR